MASPISTPGPSTVETERTPLLPQTRQKVPRSVTFNANPVSKTIEPESLPSSLSTSPAGNILLNPGPTPSHTFASGSSTANPPLLSTLNNRLRRRNSHGGAPTFSSLAPIPVPKIGPQRTSKIAQKLKLLPTPEVPDEGPDEESGREVYSQYTRIKDPTARRDAARLGKADRDRLPRVTAYCTANKYAVDGLMRFLKGKGKTRGSNPKLIDECIYTPYRYDSKNAARQENPEPTSVAHEIAQRPAQVSERRHSTGEVEDLHSYQRQDLIDLQEEAHESLMENDFNLNGGALRQDFTFPQSHPYHSSESPFMDEPDRPPRREQSPDFDTVVHTPEVFLFDYGVVVIWGMTLAQEQRFLKEIAKFETEKLDPDDVETECFNFYYTQEYQARIYNDFITLRDKNNYMTKLAISHALAQSVKTSLFEELIASTVETCKDIPTQIALTGKISLSRTQINMQIGELFILRINIHLNGSVLDTPELFWVEPQLEPVYQAVRSYLEMDQRVGLLTERLDVIADLLAVLKDQLSHGHGEKLEWIVIVLIAAEILVAAVNIVVDLYAGVD